MCVNVVGDLMQHCGQVSGAKARGADGKLNFASSFRWIKPYLKDSDLTVGNLETVVMPGESHCYPRFRAPPEYLETLADAGFDALSLANNHALDHGAEGLSETRRQVIEHGMTPFGTSEDPTYVVVDVAGVSVALFGVTRFTNRRCDGDACARCVSKKKGARKALLEAVREAAFLNDVVLVILHWMPEYVIRPAKRQWTLGKELLAAGATAVFGSHPHVLGWAELLAVTEDGQTTRVKEPLSAVAGRLALIRFTLGNFWTGMKKKPVRLGGIEQVCFAPGPSGVFEVASHHFVPTYVKRWGSDGKRNGYEILPLSDAAWQCQGGDSGLEGLGTAVCREILDYWAYARRSGLIKPLW